MRPAAPALTPFRAGVAANFVLAWRAVLRDRAFRTVGGILALLGIAGPVLASAFLFFVEDHTRAEILASNVLLWSFVYAFLLLPPVAARINCHMRPVFNALAPVAPESVLLGRFLGVLSAYLMVGAVQILPAAVLEGTVFTGRPGLLVWLGLKPLVLGMVLTSGVWLFAQLGGVLLSSLALLIWFVLGTQKATLLASIDADWANALLSVALCWLPDFVLLQIGGYADTLNGSEHLGIGAGIVYGLFFVSLDLLAAVLVVRRRWGGSEPR